MGTYLRWCCICKGVGEYWEISREYKGWTELPPFGILNSKMSNMGVGEDGEVPRGGGDVA